MARMMSRQPGFVTDKKHFNRLCDEGYLTEVW